MENVQNRGRWTNVLVLSLASSFLYHVGIGVGVGFLLFLVPLQVLFVRRGTLPTLAGVAGVLLTVAVVRAISRASGPVPEGWEPFLRIEFFALGVLMGGLLLANRTVFPRVAGVHRILAVTALTGLLSILLMRYLQGSASFAAASRQVFQQMLEVLTASGLPLDGLVLPAAGSAGAPGAQTGGLSADTLQQVIGGLFLRSYLFEYLLLLTGSWWLGSLVGARTLGRPSPITRLAAFHLPDWMIWPLILGLALVLLDIFGRLETAGAGAAGILGWNAALVFLFLYGLAGIGIIRHLFAVFRVPRGLRALIVMGLIVLLLSPRAGLIVLLLIPGLGIAETWIKFRKIERSEDSK